MSMLMTEALMNLERDLATRRLSEGEINALEYYSSEQMIAEDAPLARAYIRQAIAELRAIRAAGVIVNLPLAPEPPPVAHLPECEAPGVESQSDVWGCAVGCPVHRAKHHDEWRATDGKWTCSTDEEHFNCQETFDTEKEAIEYGQEYAAENGLEDGRLFWTGKIEHVTAGDLANCFDGDNLVEAMELHLYDNLGDEVDYNVDATKAEVADLEARVRPIIERWLVDTKSLPSCSHIHFVKSHVFHQCEEVDSSRFDPNNHPRCIRHAKHDGEHDFP